MALVGMLFSDGAGYVGPKPSTNPFMADPECCTVLVLADPAATPAAGLAVSDVEEADGTTRVWTTLSSASAVTRLVAAALSSVAIAGGSVDAVARALLWHAIHVSKATGRAPGSQGIRPPEWSNTTAVWALLRLVLAKGYLLGAAAARPCRCVLALPESEPAGEHEEVLVAVAAHLFAGVVVRRATVRVVGLAAGPVALAHAAAPLSVPAWLRLHRQLSADVGGRVRCRPGVNVVGDVAAAIATAQDNAVAALVEKVVAACCGRHTQRLNAAGSDHAAFEAAHAEGCDESDRLLAVKAGPLSSAPDRAGLRDALVHVFQEVKQRRRHDAQLMAQRRLRDVLAPVAAQLRHEPAPAAHEWLNGAVDALRAFRADRDTPPSILASLTADVVFQWLHPNAAALAAAHAAAAESRVAVAEAAAAATDRERGGAQLAAEAALHSLQEEAHHQGRQLAAAERHTERMSLQIRQFLSDYDALCRRGARAAAADDFAAANDDVLVEPSAADVHSAIAPLAQALAAALSDAPLPAPPSPPRERSVVVHRSRLAPLLPPAVAPIAAVETFQPVAPLPEPRVVEVARDAPALPTLPLPTPHEDARLRRQLDTCRDQLDATAAEGAMLQEHCDALRSELEAMRADLASEREARSRVEGLAAARQDEAEAAAQRAVATVAEHTASWETERRTMAEQLAAAHGRERELSQARGVATTETERLRAEQSILHSKCEEYARSTASISAQAEASQRALARTEQSCDALKAQVGSLTEELRSVRAELQSKARDVAAKQAELAVAHAARLDADRDASASRDEAAAANAARAQAEEREERRVAQLVGQLEAQRARADTAETAAADQRRERELSAAEQRRATEAVEARCAALEQRAAAEAARAAEATEAVASSTAESDRLQGLLQHERRRGEHSAKKFAIVCDENAELRAALRHRGTAPTRSTSPQSTAVPPHAEGLSNRTRAVLESLLSSIPDHSGDKTTLLA